jgi:hypothetical protein
MSDDNRQALNFGGLIEEFHETLRIQKSTGLHGISGSASFTRNCWISTANHKGGRSSLRLD